MKTGFYQTQKIRATQDYQPIETWSTSKGSSFNGLQQKDCRFTKPKKKKNPQKKGF